MISIGELKSMLPTHTTLTYVDYNDNLNNSAAELAVCLRENHYDSLMDKEFEWFQDARDANVDSYLNELRPKIAERLLQCGERFKDKYENLRETDRLLEVWREELECEIYQRDDSTPLEDLLGNTQPFTMTYNTGVHIDPNNETIGRNVWRIKARLKIKGNEYDALLRELCANLFYEGDLFICFYASIGKPYITQKEAGDDYKKIQFGDFHLAVINYQNGSGYDVHLKGCEVKLPFNRQNLDIDTYYSDNVCGMVKNWAKETKIRFE